MANYRKKKTTNMRSILTTLILTICSLTIFAQDKITDELKALIDNNQYDKVIEQYASNSKNYSAKSIYYIGFAYYMKEDDKNCLKFMNLSITKDSKAPEVYYIKASTLNFMKEYEKAVENFQIAINLKSDHGESYSGLGDAYYNLKKFDLALEAYKKATEQKKAPDRAYARIGQIYSELNQKDKALEAYYVAKEKISKKSDSYKNALFNIGTFEYLKGNYDKAEPMFLQLVEIDSTDYFNYPKLIQIYFHRKDYNAANRYKSVLYAAHKKGQLKDNLKDMFCFDQFKWNDKLIQAFERYEDNSTEIYEKHRFYIVNQNDEVDFKIQTENSPISVEQGGEKYLLCMTKNGSHSTFSIGFNDNLKYDDLKNRVIDILEGKIKPTATTRLTKK
jgi:tetratricopeptide (TPR) repeat protein